MKTIGELVQEFSIAHFKENASVLIDCAPLELEMMKDAKTEQDLLAIFPDYGLSKVEVEGQYVLVGEPTIAEETCLQSLNLQLIDFIVGRHQFNVKDERPFIKELLKSGFRDSAELCGILFSLVNTDDEQVFITGIDIIGEVADYLSTETHKFRALLSTDKLVRELAEEQAVAQRSAEILAPPVKKPVTKETKPLTLELPVAAPLLELALPTLELTQKPAVLSLS